MESACTIVQNFPSKKYQEPKIPSVNKNFSLSLSLFVLLVKYVRVQSEAQEQASRPISLSWSSFIGMIKRVYTAQHLLLCVCCGLQRQRRAVDPGQNSLGDPLEAYESRFKFCVSESASTDSTPDRRPSLRWHICAANFSRLIWSSCLLWWR